MDKGKRRTYGRGPGERQYFPIPVFKSIRQKHSRLFEAFHTKYPQTGAYTSDK